MATRVQNVSPRHVEALNIIDVEFAGSSAAERAVRDAWKAHLDHLSTPTATEGWGVRRVEKLVDLLYAMARALNYDFDKVDIKNAVYHPTALVELDDDQRLSRKALIAMLNGKISLPVHSVSPPGASQVPQLQDPDAQKK